jgi:hypothetical protein
MQGSRMRRLSERLPRESSTHDSFMRRLLRVDSQWETTFVVR